MASLIRNMTRSLSDMSSKNAIANGMQQPNEKQESHELVLCVRQSMETTEPKLADLEETKGSQKMTSEGKQKHLILRFEKLLPDNINRPLIPLKVALFCWFGAGAAVAPFVGVHFKQLGLSISDFSFIYIILPPSQFFGPAIAGVIADKIGRSKPVLIGCLLLVMIFVTAMIFVPSDIIHICPKTQMELSCDHHNPTEMAFEGWAACGIPPSQKKQAECNLQCSEDANDTIAEYCAETDDSMCSTLSWKNTSKRFIISVIPERELSNNTFKQCSYNVNLFHLNSTSPGNVSCSFIHFVRGCNFTCFINFTTEKQPWNSECKTSNKNRSQLFGIALFLMMMYHTTFTATYRFFDVTSVTMVKTYHSNYGQQRFWSIFGILVFSPLAGYIVDATSPTGGPKNYHHAFYLCEFMIVITIFVLCILDVEIATPEKNMWKKSTTLLKNIDVLVFLFIVFVLGTFWGFTKIFSFWYLEGLNAPSTLLGLLPAVSSLTGLPFLMTSPWWIAKFGSKVLIVKAFLCYIIFCLGYAFLGNPWWSVLYELTGIFTYNLLWVAVITHAAKLAPEGLLATTMTVTGGLHYGIGKGSGSLIGGQIMSYYDAKTAYQAMAIIAAFVATLYASYIYFRSRYLKKQQAKTGTTE